MAQNTPESEDSPSTEEMPDRVRTEFLRIAGPGEPLRLSISTDIRLDGTFGPAWLMATDRRLLAISPNGKPVPDSVQLPLSQVKEVELQDLFSSGALKVRTDSEGTTFARFSKTLSPQFARIPAQIEELVRKARPDEVEDLIKKKQISTALPRRRRRCETCGQVIPHRMGVCPVCMDSTKLISRLLSYTFSYWGLAVASLTILLTATFIGLTPPLLMRTLIDDVLAPASTNATTPVFAPREEIRTPGRRSTEVPLRIPSGGGPSRTLTILVILLLLINLSRNALGALRTYLLARLGQQITFDLRRQVYHHLHRLSLSFYNERETGRIMASITQDVSRLQDFLSDGLQEAIRDVLTILIICSILFYMNPGLAALVLIPTPLIILVTIYFGNLLHDIYHILWRRWAGISALLADVIPGVRVVKAFAQENREVNRFETRSQDLLEGELRAARMRSLFSPSMTFLTSLGGIIIWWVGGHKVLGGSLSLGEFVAFTSYMMRFYGPVESLCRLNHRFQRAATSAERVFEVLDTQPDVADPKGARPIPPIEGRVEFRNASFSYEPGKSILKDLTFTVEPGEMIGLAGHSGAGKSTLINLICRFYDVEEGAILIDGHDLRDVTRKSLRDQIGVVLQDPFLFNGTVADNIAYGKPEASLEEIVAAAKAANAHGFILNTADGYDTVLGERGVRLSGGERQRISIARAILRDPRILILDEATASMDTETEAAIQQALERLIKGRTTFAIAHRLSTLKNSSRLLILEKGELVEIGTHNELIAYDGIYARLCRMQTEMSRIRAV